MRVGFRPGLLDAAASAGAYNRTMSPTIATLRRAKKRLENLSPEKLRVADDFLAYLEERESNGATEELLAIPGFMERLAAAEQEAREGRLTFEELLRRHPQEKAEEALRDLLSSRE